MNCTVYVYILVTHSSPTSNTWTKLSVSFPDQLIQPKPKPDTLPDGDSFLAPVPGLNLLSPIVVPRHMSVYCNERARVYYSKLLPPPPAEGRVQELAPVTGFTQYLLRPIFSVKPAEISAIRVS